MKPRTHTVTGGYVSRDGKRRVYVKDHPLPLECEEPLEDGAAVVIDGKRAVRAGSGMEHVSSPLNRVLANLSTEGQK